MSGLFLSSVLLQAAAATELQPAGMTNVALELQPDYELFGSGRWGTGGNSYHVCLPLEHIKPFFFRGFQLLKPRKEKKKIPFLTRPPLTDRHPPCFPSRLNIYDVLCFEFSEALIVLFFCTYVITGFITHSLLQAKFKGPFHFGVVLFCCSQEHLSCYISSSTTWCIGAAGLHF